MLCLARLIRENDIDINPGGFAKKCKAAFFCNNIHVIKKAILVTFFILALLTLIDSIDVPLMNMNTQVINPKISNLYAGYERFNNEQIALETIGNRYSHLLTEIAEQYELDPLNSRNVDEYIKLTRLQSLDIQDSDTYQRSRLRLKKDLLIFKRTNQNWIQFFLITNIITGLGFWVIASVWAWVLQPKYAVLISGIWIGIIIIFNFTFLAFDLFDGIGGTVVTFEH